MKYLKKFESLDYHNLVNDSIDQLKYIFDNVWQVDNSEHWDMANRPSDKIKKTK